LPSRDLADTASAFATARIRAPRLFDAIAAAVRQRLPSVADDGDTSFSPHELAKLAWAFAATADAGAREPKAFVRAIAETAASSHDGRGGLAEAFAPRDLASLAWALASLDDDDGDDNLLDDDDDDSTFRDVVRALAEATAASGTVLRAPEARAQLALVALRWRLTVPDDCPLPLEKDDDALRAVRDHAPALQRDVAAVLERLRKPFVLDYETPEGLVVDFADPVAKRVVLADGPARYLRDAKTSTSRDRYLELTGATRLKTALLRRLGWRVAQVPFFEWDQLYAPEVKDDYLRGKLQGL